MLAPPSKSRSENITNTKNGSHYCAEFTVEKGVTAPKDVPILVPRTSGFILCGGGGEGGGEIKAANELA